MSSAAERPQPIEVWRAGERVSAAREAADVVELVLPANTILDAASWSRDVLDGLEHLGLVDLEVQFLGTIGHLADGEFLGI